MVNVKKWLIPALGIGGLLLAGAVLVLMKPTSQLTPAVTSTEKNATSTWTGGISPSDLFSCENGKEFRLGLETPNKIRYWENTRDAATGKYPEYYLGRVAGISNEDSFSDGQHAVTLIGGNYGHVLITNLATSTDGSADITCKQIDEITGRPVTWDVATTTYTNKDFGFSFVHPSSWQIDKDYSSRRWTPGTVFAVRFVDPQREKEILISDCLNNRMEGGGWANLKPTREECAPIFKTLSLKDQKKYETILFSRDLYARVYESNFPLKDWLLLTYKGRSAELRGYEVGDEIKLSGEQGYYSATGCCMSIDRAYVIKKGRYIYEFGSNSDALGLVERFKDGFQLLPASENVLLPKIDVVTEKEKLALTQYCKSTKMGSASERFLNSSTTLKWQHEEHFGDSENEYQSAEVWTDKGNVLYVRTFNTSPSGDWAQFDDYCFRKDGTLAKVLETLNTFYSSEEGGVRVFKDHYFSERGDLIASSTQVLNMQNSKSATDATFQDRDTPVYKTTKQLPFFDLIGEP